MDPSLLGQSRALWLALHISNTCRKLQGERQQIDWLKAWHAHRGLWWLGWSKEFLLLLRWFPGWDMLAGVDSPPVGVDRANEGCPLGCPGTYWAQKRQFSG